MKLSFFENICLGKSKLLSAWALPPGGQHFRKINIFEENRLASAWVLPPGDRFLNQMLFVFERTS